MFSAPIQLILSEEHSKESVFPKAEALYQHGLPAWVLKSDVKLFWTDSPVSPAIYEVSVTVLSLLFFVLKRYPHFRASSAEQLLLPRNRIPLVSPAVF